MKERPMLFSGAMVRAILDGRKTQTRRVVKAIGPDTRYVMTTGEIGLPAGAWREDGWLLPDIGPKFKCPYGVPSDRLWVRETWQEIAHPDSKAFPCDHVTIYRADGEDQIIDGHKAEIGPWKPSIFMSYPRSRINLEITGVRVERLQAISEADAIAEGLTKSEHDHGIYWGIQHADVWERDPRDTFHRLWDSINGKSVPWASNPWVWVLEFKQVQP